MDNAAADAEHSPMPHMADGETARKLPLFGPAQDATVSVACEASPTSVPVPCVQSNGRSSDEGSSSGAAHICENRDKTGALVRMPSCKSFISSATLSLLSSVASLFRSDGTRNDPALTRSMPNSRRRYNTEVISSDGKNASAPTAPPVVTSNAADGKYGTSSDAATATPDPSSINAATATPQIKAIPFPLRRAQTFFERTSTLQKSTSLPDMRSHASSTSPKPMPPLRILPRRTKTSDSASSLASSSASLGSSPSSSTSAIFEPEGKPIHRVPSLPDLKDAVKSIARHGSLGQLKRGASKAHIPYVSMPELDETRVSTITFKEFRERCRSGDLVLVSSSGTVGRILRRVSNSVYSHVMMIYREGTTGADGPTRVFHATHSPGFDLRRQVSAENQTRLNCDAGIVMMKGPVVWRPLNLAAERLQEVHTRMDELIDELCGVPFPEHAKFATNYMRGVFGWQKAGDPDPETRFCSELIALVLMNTGLLLPDVVPWSFSPPMFSEALHKRLDERMVDAKYGREHLIVFTDEELDQAKATTAHYAAIMATQAQDAAGSSDSAHVEHLDGKANAQAADSILGGLAALCIDVEHVDDNGKTPSTSPEMTVAMVPSARSPNAIVNFPVSASNTATKRDGHHR